MNMSHKKSLYTFVKSWTVIRVCEYVGIRTFH